MPRGFTDQEKSRIRRELLSVGTRKLLTVGVRKTTVEDLAYSVNISKGAFYKFFDSKEALFFSVIEEMEANIKQRLTRDLIHLNAANAESLLKSMLKKLMRSEEVRTFTSFHEDTDLIIQGIGQHTISQHNKTDLETIQAIFSVLAEKDIPVYMSAEKAVAFSRALFWIQMGQQSFEGMDYGDVIDSIVDKFVEECLIKRS